MKSCEPFIAASSDYYNYVPSLTARNTFFYPTSMGHFIYEPGYRLQRSSFDSFLLLYIESGELIVELENQSVQAPANSFILLDCYAPHAYHTLTGCSCIWFHFDGPVARAHYELVISRHGNVFRIHDPQPVLNKMQKIYHTFSSNETIREALLSKQISDILTTMLLYSPMHPEIPNYTSSIEEIVSYINEHFAEDLSIAYLAELAALSPYHFIRIFKKETGFTPHEYLVNTRISTAKYLLKTTRLPIKDICFSTGFSGESVFCTSFKKNVGQTPAQYRSESG